MGVVKSVRHGHPDQLEERHQDARALHKSRKRDNRGDQGCFTTAQSEKASEDRKRAKERLSRSLRWNDEAQFVQDAVQNDGKDCDKIFQDNFTMPDQSPQPRTRGNEGTERSPMPDQAADRRTRTRSDRGNIALLSDQDSKHKEHGEHREHGLARVSTGLHGLASDYGATKVNQVNPACGLVVTVIYPC